LRFFRANGVTVRVALRDEFGHTAPEPATKKI
jgi:hypothetical protein